LLYYVVDSSQETFENGSRILYGGACDFTEAERVKYSVTVKDADSSIIYTLEDKSVCLIPVSLLKQYQESHLLEDMAREKIYSIFSHYIRDNYMYSYIEFDSWLMKLSRFDVTFKQPLEVFDVTADEEECGYDLSSFGNDNNDQIWLEYQRNLQELCKFKKIGVELREKFKENVMEAHTKDIETNMFNITLQTKIDDISGDYSFEELLKNEDFLNNVNNTQLNTQRNLVASMVLSNEKWYKKYDLYVKNFKRIIAQINKFYNNMARDCSKMFENYEWDLDQDELFAKDTSFDISEDSEEDYTQPKADISDAKYNSANLGPYDNTIGVGAYGGTCMCWNGETYLVGDNSDNCNSLACVNGIFKSCVRQAEKAWAGKKVICSVDKQALSNKLKMAYVCNDLKTQTIRGWLQVYENEKEWIEGGKEIMENLKIFEGQNIDVEFHDPMGDIKMLLDVYLETIEKDQLITELMGEFDSEEGAIAKSLGAAFTQAETTLDEIDDTDLDTKNTKLEEISKGFEQEQAKWSDYYIKYMTYINNVRKIGDLLKKDQLFIPRNMEKHRKWITIILGGIKEYMKQANNDSKKTESARSILNVMLDNFIIVDEAESEKEINTRISTIMETLFTCYDESDSTVCSDHGMKEMTYIFLQFIKQNLYSGIVTGDQKLNKILKNIPELYDNTLPDQKTLPLKLVTLGTPTTYSIELPKEIDYSRDKDHVPHLGDDEYKTAYNQLYAVLYQILLHKTHTPKDTQNKNKLMTDLEGLLEVIQVDKSKANEIFETPLLFNNETSSYTSELELMQKAPTIITSLLVKVLKGDSLDNDTDDGDNKIVSRTQVRGPGI